MIQFVRRNTGLFVVCFVLVGVFLGCSDHSKNTDSAKPQNFATASFDTVKRAAEGGDANAQNRLGEIYFIGLDVDRDIVEAEKWFRKAAEQGNASGQYSLGLMYLDGFVVAKDEAEAKRLFRKAAGQGHILAKAELKKMEK